MTPPNASSIVKFAPSGKELNKCERDILLTIENNTFINESYIVYREQGTSYCLERHIKPNRFRMVSEAVMNSTILKPHLPAILVLFSFPLHPAQ